jgi:tellurite resistance protein
MDAASVELAYSEAQISVWLRGLLTIAWADGDFDETEQQLITSLTHQDLKSASEFQPIQTQELSAALGQDPHMAENFLRTAVMVAIADGLYTSKEDALLEQFCKELGAGDDILEMLRLTLHNPDQAPSQKPEVPLDVLHPVRDWLDHLEIHDPKVAHFLCKMIPSQCPFERDITLFGRKIVHIPPLCKLNPLYEQMVGLRFRALSYLADKCGEDVAEYI